MDALGHVNNTVYFRYMEQARIEWLEKLAAQTGFAARGQGPVIVHASCNFLMPLVYPGEVDVEVSADSPGRSSVMTYYELTTNGRKYADGMAKIVWIDYASGRSIPLPDALVAAARGAAG
jgi:acyl-CoA thioester hydrolase